MSETLVPTAELYEFAEINPETLAGNNPGNYPFRYVDLSAADRGAIHWNSVDWTTFIEAPSRARRVTSAGDALFGTVRPYLQSHGYVPSDEKGPIVASTGFSVIRAMKGISNASFLFHTIMGSAVFEQANRHAVGSSYPAVTERDVAKFRVFSPPVAHQSKIAEVLDTLDAAIRGTEAVVAKLKAIKQGLLHDLLTRGVDANGDLRPPHTEAPHLYKETPLGWLPKEWDAKLLDDIAIRGSGHTPSKSVSSYWNGGIKWVSLADSHRLDQGFIHETDKEISEAGLANSSAVRHSPGTVILSRDAGIGKSAILASEMAVSQHFMAWSCGSKLNHIFLYYVLQRAKPRFEAIAMGSTIKTIGLDFFKKYQIATPPKPEQDRAAEVLLQTESDIVRNEQELRKLRATKAGLMDDLLTGRVSVAPLLEEGAAHGA